MGGDPLYRNLPLIEELTSMKELRLKCKECGVRFTVIRLDRERISPYCTECRTERKREQTRLRVQRLRDKGRQGRGVGPRQIGLDGRLYPHQDPVEP